MFSINQAGHFLEQASTIEVLQKNMKAEYQIVLDFELAFYHTVRLAVLVLNDSFPPPAAHIYTGINIFIFCLFCLFVCFFFFFWFGGGGWCRGGK
jgi:hypothetical protein